MDWHRLFGLVLIDFFTGSDYVVELEKDLSVKKQRLDVVIVRKGSGAFPGRLPDGLDDLTAHNLISFKSYQEALDGWTLKELVGYYVNYRKQVSPSLQQLLPEEDFRLYGICARYPSQLAGQVTLEERQPGVYDCQWGTDVIRLVVLRQLPQVEHNAPLHLFSAAVDQVRFAAGHYRQQSPDSSTLIQRLVDSYRTEGIAMPYTMEDFRKEIRKEVLEGLSLEERLEGLSPQEIIKGLSPDALLKYLPPEEILKALPQEEIEKYLKKRQNEAAKPDKQDNAESND